MGKWTIGQRIALGFAFTQLLIFVMGINNYMLVGKVKEEAQANDTRSLQAALNIGAINNDLPDLNAALFHAVSAQTPDESRDAQEHATQMFERLQKEIDEYSTNFLSPEEAQALKTIHHRYLNASNKMLAMIEQGKNEEALAFSSTTLEPAYSTFVTQVDKLTKRSFKEAREASKTIWHNAMNAQNFIGIAALVMMLLGLGIPPIINKGISQILIRIAQSLNQGSNQVLSAANQVTGSSQVLAESASQQAASIEETSASLTEISSTIDHNSHTAQETKAFTEQTRQAAEQGARSTQEMNQSIDGIKHASQKMQSAMSAIKQASSDISNIIKTIDEIAFQTNLLALNAAVEAARAGEAGAGFAVVADEVRNLAQRSAKAAKETASLIETAIHRSETGESANKEVIDAIHGVVLKSDEVAKRLQEIVAKVQQTDDQVAKIATASREQSQGISQINHAVSQMEKVTQSNASNAEESAAAAQELNSQAEVLKNAVTELQTLVSGPGSVVPSPIVSHTHPHMPVIHTPRKSSVPLNFTHNS